MATAIALWLMATGRWGSYVGDKQLGLFVTEVAIGVALILLLWRVKQRRVDFTSLRHPSPAVALALSLLALASLRLVASDALTRDALRDFAPYGYALVTVLTLLAPVARWERAAAVPFAALTAHAAWVAATQFTPRLVRWFHEQGDPPIFATRPDFDATICGIGVALCIYWLRRGSTTPATAAAVTALGLVQAALVLSLPTRAGLLATLVSVAFVASATMASKGRVFRGRTLVKSAAVVVVLVPVAMFALAQTSPGKRFVDSMQGQGQAAGTTNARQLAWQTTAEYTVAEPTRAIFGVGFGPDFLHESGADAFYEGDLYSGVRSPHNYVLGTGARLGIGGALLVLALMAASVIAAWRVLRTPADLTALDVVAAAVTAGIPVAAMMGVILESPFGAVPYFWAIGHLARVKQLRDTRGGGAADLAAHQRERSTVDANQTTG